MHRSIKRGSPLRASVLLAALAATPAFAQTSGSWNVNANGNYSDAANWLGGVPNAGGVATFGTFPALASNRGVTVDISPTLSGMSFESAYAYILTGGGPITLTGPATLNVSRSNADSPLNITSGHNLSVPIAGSSGLTKTGDGTITLLAASTYTGTTTVNGGVLALNVGDASLGTSGDVVINDAALRFGTAAFTSARNFAITGDAEFQVFNNTTLSGVISGTGSLVRRFGAESNVLRLSGDNTYTGSTVVRGGFLLLDGASGAIRNSATIDVAGLFGIENSNGANDSRLNANANLISRGSRLAFGVNASVDATHSVNTLTLASGRTELLMTSLAGRLNTVQLGAIDRENRSTLFLRGVSIGSDQAVVKVTQAPVTIGGGGAAGTTTQSIVPYVIANTTTNQFSLGNTFVTYDAATGRLRPLDVATEYEPSLTTATPNANVRITPAVGGTANPVALGDTAVTINSLIVASPAAVGNSLTITGTQPLTITSGAITTTPTNTLNSTSFNVPLNFGTAEGITHNQSGNTIVFNRPISGSGGYTAGGTGLVSFGVDSISTYSGVTTFIGGTIQFNSDILPNVPGNFGSSNTAIVMGSSSLATGSGASARLFANGIFRVDRDIVIKGDPINPSVFGTTAAANRELIVNGDVALEGSLGIEHGAGTGIVTINGDITGSGQVTGVGTSSGTTYLSGNNTFTGGLNVLNSIFYAGSNTAFGTGTVFISNTGANPGANARLGAFGGPRTLANDLVLRNNLVVVGTETLTFTGDVDLGGGNPGTGGVAFQLNVGSAATLALAGVVEDGGINKTGTGTLVLSAANAYTGGTTVTAGTLRVSNTTGSATGTNAVNVLASATFTGSGRVAGPVTVASNSTLAPGSGAGLLTVDSSVTLADLTNLSFELGTVSDRVSVGGALSLDGVLTVTQAAGFANGTYTLFTVAGAITDNGVVVTPLPGGVQATIDLSTPGQVNLVVVPEPASLLAIAVSSLTLVSRRR